MAVNKATTVDNKKITEGPATMRDSNEFEICAIRMQEIVKMTEKNEKPNNKNTKMVATKVRRQVLSTDLMQGMVISARSGGKPDKNRPVDEMVH